VHSKISPSLIADELTKTGKFFQSNELAYLALTGKIELPIRDKLAFNLHKNLSGEGYIVSREWIRKRKRCDLAITKDGTAIALLELKAMYTFNGTQKYLYSVNKMIESDLRKCEELADPYTKIYAILLATHPHKKLGDGLSRTIKYIDPLNKALGRQTEDKICNDCRHAVSDVFSKYKDKFELGRIEAGECFGTKVSILFWVFGPFSKDDGLTL